MAVQPDCKHKLLIFLHSFHFDRPNSVMEGSPDLSGIALIHSVKETPRGIELQITIKIVLQNDCICVFRLTKEFNVQLPKYCESDPTMLFP